ncbi:MAG: A/G-specific adenine glycosylase [Xanthomonadales bacterium]
MPEAATPPFADRLLAWWARHGRHDLPWQHPRTPYRVWISEVMLQQTQVATVIPYFERWMTDFRDIATLAAASRDDVLARWSGLGYYARARNIHRTAALCVRDHAGELPLDPNALESLPGIGRSTANAIISQSTDRPAAILDGNVRRVLARHTATRGWTGSTAVQRQLWAAAENRLPTDRGADYSQAIMDLGALVCVRRQPRCDDCPVAADCRALRAGIVDELPEPKPKTKVGERRLHMLVVRDPEGRVLLEKRPGSGIWGGLWCLPEGDSPAAVATGLGIEPDGHAALPPFAHRLSHLRLEIHPILAQGLEAGQVRCGARHGWFDRHARQGLGLPRPVAILLERIDTGEFQ